MFSNLCIKLDIFSIICIISDLIPFILVLPLKVMCREGLHCSCSVIFLSVTRIIMSQLERRETDLLTNLSPVCHGWTPDMTSSFSTIWDLKKWSTVIHLFSKDSLTLFDIVLDAAEWPQTITEWFSVLWRVWGGFLEAAKHKAGEGRGLWPQGKQLTSLWSALVRACTLKFNILYIYFVVWSNPNPNPNPFPRS